MAAASSLPATPAPAAQTRSYAAVVRGAPSPAGAPRGTKTSGGTYSGDLQVKPPQGQTKFEPLIGRAGYFKHVRQFVVPSGSKGVIIQRVTRKFASVRKGSPTSGKPTLAPAEIDELVRRPKIGAKPEAEAYAKHQDYFEAFLVHGPQQRRGRKAGRRKARGTSIQDTFAMTSIMSRRATNPKNKTSGNFTMTADARFFPHDKPHELLHEFGFTPQHNRPANGLPGRPSYLATHKHRNLTMDLIALHTPPTGRVRHKVAASWNTFDGKGGWTTLKLNGKRWVEPPTPPKRP